MTDVWVAVGGVLLVALVILVASCVERYACRRRQPRKGVMMSILSSTVKKEAEERIATCEALHGREYPPRVRKTLVEDEEHRISEALVRSVCPLIE